MLFAVGSMKDPTPLVNYVYETFVSNEAHKMRTSEFYLPRVDTEFFKSLYTESAIPLTGSALHNEFINISDRVDTNNVYVPSKLYWFKDSAKELKIEGDTDTGEGDNLKLEAMCAVKNLELLTKDKQLLEESEVAIHQEARRNLKRNVKDAHDILGQIEITDGCSDFPVAKVKAMLGRAENFANKTGNHFSPDSLCCIKKMKRVVNDDFTAWLKKFKRRETHPRRLYYLSKRWERRFECKMFLKQLRKLIHTDEDDIGQEASNIMREERPSRCDDFDDFVTLTNFMRNTLEVIRKRARANENWIQHIEELSDTIEKLDEYLLECNDNRYDLLRILRDFNKGCEDEDERKRYKYFRKCNDIRYGFQHSDLIRNAKLLIEKEKRWDLDNAEKGRLYDLMSKIDQFLKPSDAVLIPWGSSWKNQVRRLRRFY